MVGSASTLRTTAPGVRPGQLHLLQGKSKYLYDFDQREFTGLPRSLTKEIANDVEVEQAIAKGARYLGLDGL